MERSSVLLVLRPSLSLAHGLRGRFERLGFRVAGEVSSPGEGLVAAARLKPDIAVVDALYVEVFPLCVPTHASAGVPVVYVAQEGEEDRLHRVVKNCPLGLLLLPCTDHQLSLALKLALFSHLDKSALDRSRRNLLDALNAIAEGLICLDRYLTIREVNAKAEKLCGFARMQSMGKAFSLLPGKCSGRCIETIAQAVKENTIQEARLIECMREDRPFQLVSILATPLADGNSDSQGVLVTVKDETKKEPSANALALPLPNSPFYSIVGKNPRMLKIFSLIEHLADLQTTVLITGQSGTGKELVAEAIHYCGMRRDKPLVKVNCSALSENLLESELFGHVKGAFTGAFKNKVGRWERADGGTIFLDEIGDISHSIQLRLLRVLQEMEFERVGDSTPIKVDVRLIAATNQDLRAKVQQGLFREDLYYRLEVVEINIPPLRERPDDIPLLVESFINKFGRQMNTPLSAVTQDVLKLFLEYSWPGNVRELEHAIEHAAVLCKGDTITLDDLSQGLKKFSSSLTADLLTALANDPAAKAAAGKPCTDMEKILSSLDATRWNKTKAARMLGISRQTIYRKLREANMLS